MAPKKVTNVERPKIKIIMTMVKFKKVGKGKWHWTDSFTKKKSNDGSSSVSESQPCISGFKRRRGKHIRRLVFMEYVSPSKQ